MKTLKFKIKIWWLTILTNYYKKFMTKMNDSVWSRKEGSNIKFKINFFYTLTDIEVIIKEFKKRNIFEKCDEICEINDIVAKVKKNKKKIFAPESDYIVLTLDGKKVKYPSKKKYLKEYFKLTSDEIPSKYDEFYDGKFDIVKDDIDIVNKASEDEINDFNSLYNSPKNDLDNIFQKQIIFEKQMKEGYNKLTNDQKKRLDDLSNDI